MTTDSAIWAVVPAAGTGSRMGVALPKQYLSLLGRPVIQHSLERLCAHVRVRGVLVGIAAEDDHWPQFAPKFSHLNKLLGTFTGGATRAQTVLNGLRALLGRAQPNDWVMVHDAARPCVRLADVDRLIDVATKSVDGGLLALPLSDTVKRVDTSQHIVETVSRVHLWRALTPQLFKVGKLEHALNEALKRGITITDEASAVEASGGKPVVVNGNPDNIKITTPEDLTIAELFLRQQELV